MKNKSFKRSDIKLRDGDFLIEIELLLHEKLKDYPAKIESTEMTEYEANKRFLILVEMRELFEDAKRKGVSMQTLKEMVSNVEITARHRQNAIQFPN